MLSLWGCGERGSVIHKSTGFGRPGRMRVVAAEAAAVVDAGKPDRAVPDLPPAVLGRTQADRVADQGFTEEDALAPPFDLAVGAHAANPNVTADMASYL